MSTLIPAYSFVSKQIREFLALLPAEDYRENCNLLNGNSIGKHFRHILETMEALCKNQNIICYDERERKLIYETDKLAFLERYRELEKFVLQFDETARIEIKHQPFPENIQAETFQSTLGREMLYNLEHIIHHLAIIKLAAISMNRCDCVPANFGIAFSTLNFQKT